ncbi:MAG TPA: PKD domain-containing protein [Ferruginibacter sp.]|nr:PKD domain-containing protein [Ferruginibacter sp.]
MAKLYTAVLYREKIFILKAFTVFLFFCACSVSSFGQCPPNIDFEMRNFTNWRCDTGRFVPPGVLTDIGTSGPVAGKHDIITAATIPATDFYGGFPKLCPNGSGTSVRLGLETTGTHAAMVTYTFTIPPGQNSFSLIYNYAIVINNSGGHLPEIQPRLEVVVTNITDNIVDTCSSDTLAYANANPLPGFEDCIFNNNIKFKPWAARSVNLDGNAGKTFEITFRGIGCGAGGGTHFGYAYIDINSECASSFIGAAYCADDTAINVTGPFGYQTYTWWDAAFTTILGTGQTINFTPPPPPGTRIALIVDPFLGYGCRDTLYADLLDTLNITANAGPDRLSCNLTPVQIGVAPRAGHVYSWSPVTGLSDPTISNPIATPSTTTQYVVTTSSSGGGCVITDTVIVSAAVLDSSLQLLGIDTYCLGDPQSAILVVQPADSIQWYRNGIAITGANQTQYNVTQSGAYHATVFSFVGCSSNTIIRTITVYDNPVAGFTSVSPLNQCFNNNLFVFTNTSTIASGTMQYSWDMGDGTVLTTTDASHSFTQTGTYTVKLLVSSGNGCVDSIFRTVTVYPNATVAANVNSNAQCFKNNSFIFTNNTTVEPGATLQYVWSLGDGNFSFVKDVTHSYALPGAYTVKLLVTTDRGCVDSLAIDIRVYPSPVAGFTVNNAQQCFGGNNFALTNTTTVFSGTLQYLWNFGDGNTATTQHVNHSYLQPGDYRIKMLATSDDGGCADSSYLDVKIFEYPTADFLVNNPACINQEVLLVNKTLNNTSSTLTYLWDFGNGQSSIVRSPSYSYPAPGNYNLSLNVSTVQCPGTINTKTIPVVIEAPAAGIVYPEKTAVFNFPEKLQARQIGNNIIWSPATSLDNRFSYTPTFRGINSQLYLIQLKTASGCITIDTQFVRTKKKVEIYVPAAFTPGNDGRNDYLRPLLMGFDHVNYFRIYDRWGRLIFQMNSDRPGWDGTFKGKPAEMQTVVWMIEAVDVDGVTHKKQGTTVLIR